MKNNKLIYGGLAAAFGFLLIKKPKIQGIGSTKFKTVDQVTNAAWKNRQTGVEKIVNEALHFGVGNKPYAYVSDIKRAGIDYTTNRNSAFGHFNSKNDLRRFVEWLNETDGYLIVE